ncbi:MAG: NADP-dependent oxidoreductase [Halieaceae bacterium]
MYAMFIDETGGPDVLTYGEIPTPSPGPGELLIKVAYAGVNPADWKNRQGLLAAFRPYTFPCVIGFDAAGTVAETGTGVTGFKVGDKVFTPTNHGRGSQGSYAEYVVADDHLVAHLPAGLGLDLAAALPIAALTAWQALFDRGALQQGQQVMIHGGAGGLGGFAVQFARWAGAKVAATCSTRNVEYLKSLGVDRVIDYQREDIAAAIADWTTAGLDLLVDAVGVSTLPDSLILVKHGGTLVSIPTLVDDPDPEVATQAALARGVTHIFSTMDDQNCAPALEKIAGLLVSGDITAPPVRQFPLQEAAEVHQIIQSGHNRGKFVLKVGNS